MLRHGLSRRDVARLLGKPLNSARGQSNSTVDSWLSGKTPMPPLAQELLKLKLRIPGSVCSRSPCPTPASANWKPIWRKS
jgi:transcriptional regulator with XRE-family HTH domain